MPYLCGVQTEYFKQADYEMLRENPAMIKAYLRDRLDMGRLGLKHWGIIVDVQPNNIVVTFRRNDTRQDYMLISSDRGLQGSTHHFPNCNCASLQPLFDMIRTGSKITLCAEMSRNIARKIKVRKIV